MTTATQTEKFLPKYCKITVLSSKVEENKLCNSYNRKYYCKVLNTSKNKSFNITFHDSVYNWQHNKKLNKLNVMYSIIMDANCYTPCMFFDDFCKEFGYDAEDKTALKAFRGCEREYYNLCETFTNKQIKRLQTIFQDY